MARCPRCGEPNPEHASFCNACGARLSEREPDVSGERRKPATLLFCDLSGSTAMGERLDAESVRDLMFRYFHRMRDAIERHGGTIEKFVGDAVMAVFGVPVAHEDDALRAVRAALEMRERVAELNEDFASRFGARIAVRIGVNTGEVVAGDPTAGELLVTGDAVNVAARLEQAAPNNGILIGDDTRRLVGEAVEVEPVDPLVLKGKEHPVPAFLVISAVAGDEARTRRGTGAFVGREGELAMLLAAFDEARSAGQCRLVTLAGPPGVGKSRLIAELTASLASAATIASGRCLPYGEGITYWPLAELVRDLSGARDEEDRDAARAKLRLLAGHDAHAPHIAEIVARAIGLDQIETTPEEIGWGVRRLLEAVARERPLVAVFDDVHWGETAFLDLVASLAADVGAPVLVVCVARPELAEVRPGWHVDVRLDPLTSEESERLIQDLLEGAGEVPILRSVRDAAEGNPLFIEELLGMLVDEGALVRDDRGWVGSAEDRAIAMPVTIGNLLASRIDRLPAATRAALERGSVEGQVFHRGAVRALSEAAERPHVEGALASAATAEFLVPAPAQFAGDAAYRFRHLLIRDATYAGITKRARADLHERFARWFEDRVADRVVEFEEILGYHLEQAVGYRSELGPLDDAGRELARRAAERLIASGRRAMARTDLSAAAGLFGRGIELLPHDDPLSSRAQVDLAGVLADAGELERADGLYERVIRDGAGGDEGLAARARIRRGLVRIHTDDASMQDVLADVEAAVPVFERLADDGGLALAWAHLGRLRFWMGWVRASEDAYERAIDHARRAGDRRRETETLAWLIGAKAHGPAPASEGVRFCDEVLGLGLHDPLLDVFAYEKRGWLLAMQGRFEEARGSVDQALAIVEEFGLRLRRGMLAFYRADVERLAGSDPEVAERELRAGYDVLASLGETAFRGSIALALSDLLYETGRFDESERLLGEVDRSEESAATRMRRARLLARRGDATGATDLARRAIAGRLSPAGVATTGRRTEIETTTEEVPQEEAALLFIHAQVFELTGYPEDAAQNLLRAVEMLEAKGDAVSAGRIRARMSGGTSGTPGPRRGHPRRASD